jgi:hypothetical protein
MYATTLNNAKNNPDEYLHMILNIWQSWNSSLYIIAALLWKRYNSFESA